MVWFFKGAAGELKIETRIDPTTSEYILQIEGPGQPPVTERFGTRETFEERVLAMERQLTAEQWKQVGGPEFLPHGWRGEQPN